MPVEPTGHVTEVIDTTAIAAAQVAPAQVAAPEPVAAAKPDDTRGKKRGAKSAPAEENKEFWETWAETKTTTATTRPEPAPASAAAEPAVDAEASEGSGRGRDRKRGGRDKRETKMDKPEAKAAAKSDEKPAGRTKRDTAVEAAAPTGAVDAAQARLFVNLGKKHGVSADDLRGLLAAPLGGDKARIGSVSLRDSHAHVRVPEETVDAIIAGVHGTSHGDQSVTVERARA